MPPTRRRRPARPAAAVSPLEPRRLFAGQLVDPSTLASQETVETPIPPVLSNLTAGSSQTVDLKNYVYDPAVPGTIATFEFNVGSISVALTDQATPTSINNFLTYVSNGTYNGTVIHRSAVLSGANGGLGTGASATNPANIVQGGGFIASNDPSIGLQSFTPSQSPIENYEAPVVGDGLSNVAGTIAYANGSAPNTAAAGFFFNNTANTGFDGSYTAFGHIISGSNVLTTIATLPTTTSINFNGKSDTVSTALYTAPNFGVPIQGLTAAQVAGGVAIQPSNLVTLYGVSAQAGTTYTVTSSDPKLVTATVTNGVATFQYGSAGAGGTATMTVTATSAFDKSAVTTSFAVTVPPASTTATGPIAAADTLAAAVTGTATVVQPLANDSDGSDSALNPATVTIVTQPTNGTATVDPVSGAITYTSAAGYTGPDTLTYTVADAAGTVSAATAVNVTVVPVPTSLVIGTGSGVGSVVFTQPDGTKGQLSVTGGKATVTFSPGLTTQTTRGGTTTVTGAGATVSGVAIVNAGAYANVSLTTLCKGSVTLGGLTDTGLIHTLNLARATVTGTVTTAGVDVLNLGTATGATLNLGSSPAGSKLTIGTATDTGLTAGVIRTLNAKSWTVDDGGSHLLTASAISSMVVPGTFADVLQVTSTSGYAITRATVGGASAPWYVNGGIYQATVASTTSNWGLQDGSLIHSLTIKGDLTGNVIAAAIDGVTVTGAMSGATIQTNGLVNKAVVQMRQVTVGGAMTNSVIYATGNIGAVSAASMSGSKVYAGVSTSLAGTATLPSATTDLSSEVTIGSVTLAGGKATFVNSNVAAYTLGTLRLGKVTTANSSTPFGLSAHAYGTVVANLNGTKTLALGPAQTKSAQVLSTYVTGKKIDLGDFVVTVY